MSTIIDHLLEHTSDWMYVGTVDSKQIFVKK